MATNLRLKPHSRRERARLTVAIEQFEGDGADLIDVAMSGIEDFLSAGLAR